MIRLCFERLPGFAPLNKSEEFVSWLEENFPDLEYRYGGYTVTDLGKTWYSAENVLWTIMMKNNIELLALIERAGWIINGYTIHAYVSEYGQNPVKINNDGFRITRDEAHARAIA